MQDPILDTQPTEPPQASNSSEAEKHYFDCKICLEESKEPVVTLCGHLYCWTCLYDWARVKHSETVPCPSCNSAVEIKKVIPLYTSKEEHARRDHAIPRRPQPTAAPFMANANGGNAAFNFGFMPFGFHFTFWGNPGANGAFAPNNNQAAPRNGGFRQLIAFLPIFLVMFLPYFLDFFSDLIDLLLSHWLSTPQRGGVVPSDVHLGEGYYYSDFDDHLDFADVIVLAFTGVIVLASIAYLVIKLCGRPRNN